MRLSWFECHISHPMSTRNDWNVGVVRGVL
jgi:hypothetical protein